MNNLSNVFTELVAPSLIKNFASDDEQQLINSYMNMDGNNNFSDYFLALNILKRMIGKIKNYDEVMIKYMKLSNIILPKTWYENYRKLGISLLLKTVQWQIDDPEEMEQIGNELIDLIEKNENVFAAIAGYALNEILDSVNMGKYTKEKLEKIKERYDNYTDEEQEKLTEKIPVKLKNVTLYHGTNYDNYIEIKKDGYIRPSDYTEGKFESENMKKMYEKETGYVFTSDSLDFPLSFLFGGYRENCLPWAYDNEDEIREKKKYTNIGVIFEINPENYNVSFYGKSGNSEFIIPGSVDLKDTIARFFYVDSNGKLKEIKEEEITDDLLNE